MDKIQNYLNNLPRVLDEEGKFASKIDRSVIENTIKLLKSLPDFYYKVIDPANHITPTGYGTIVIDWYHRKNFVSVEVGTTKVGWFSELPDGVNSKSDGTDFDGVPPQELISALNKLYGR